LSTLCIPSRTQAFLHTTGNSNFLSIINLKNNRFSLKYSKSILYSALPENVSFTTNKFDKNAEKVFDILAQRNRTWKRLSPLVKLACQHNDGKISVIADIGCDHGLLSIALALSGKFQKVFGVDVSERALMDGAISNYNKVLNYTKTFENREILSNALQNEAQLLEFRHGNGLTPLLNDVQIDALCLAGMGIHTMTQILFPGTNHKNKKNANHKILESIGCQHVFLQPTNSKPRNLIQLYDIFQKSGWSLKAERIEKLASRWYITCYFSRSIDNKNQDDSTKNTENMNLIPGAFLNTLDQSHRMFPIYKEYVEHHKSWLNMDENNKSYLSKEDERWLKSTSHI